MSVTRKSVAVAITIGSLIGIFIGVLLVTDVVAFFPVGICVGPLTFHVRIVEFHGGASVSFVIDYIAGSWFPGRNM